MPVPAGKPEHQHPLPQGIQRKQLVLYSLCLSRRLSSLLSFTTRENCLLCMTSAFLTTLYTGVVIIRGWDFSRDPKPSYLNPKPNRGGDYLCYRQKSHRGSVSAAGRSRYFWAKRFLLGFKDLGFRGVRFRIPSANTIGFRLRVPREPKTP